jgi:hypothetical protein
MTTRWWFLVLVTLAVGLPAFVLGRVVWPDTSNSIVVPADLVPYFALPSLFEALAFGGGVAFLLAFGPVVRRAGSRLAIAAYLGTAWLLMAAWPHGNLHRSLGFDLASIARIEWAIHLTALLAAVVVALFVARALRGPRPMPHSGVGQSPLPAPGART